MTTGEHHEDPRDARILQLELLLTKALARIEVLEQRVAELERENAELRAKLGQNSSNSSKPPSSDGPQVEKQSKAPTGRKRGGQPGHEGAKRVRLTPTVVVDHWPARCRRCSTALQPGMTTPDVAKWHQVVELPVVTPEVTEHRAHALACSCGVVTEATLPGDVVLHGFGPRLTATVSYFSGRCKLSKRMTVECLSDLFSTKLSTGAVCGLEQDVSQALAKPYAEVCEAVPQQARINADETSWTENKSKAWLWVACTSVAIVFRIARSRGKAVAKELIGEGFAGILTTDRWSGYNWVAAVQRQLCWAHLLRDMQGMVDRGGVGGRLGRQMLDEVEKMFDWWAEVRDGKLERAVFQQNMLSVRATVERLLLAGSTTAEKKTAGMCAEILKLKVALWTFVDHEGVEPTNNVGERAVRPAVMWRKGCFGTDSERGSRFVERILTTVATVRLRGGNVLGYLTAACEAHRRGAVVPSLLGV